MGECGSFLGIGSELRIEIPLRFADGYLLRQLAILKRYSEFLRIT